MKCSKFICRSRFYLFPILCTACLAFLQWDIWLTGGIFHPLEMRDQNTIVLIIDFVLWGIGLLVIFFQYSKLRWPTRILHLLTIVLFSSTYILTLTDLGHLLNVHEEELGFYLSIGIIPVFYGFYIRDYVRWHKKEKQNLT